MRNPLKRKPKPYVVERDRLLEWLAANDPDSEEYETVMRRLNELDRILNRTTEKFKTIVPALGTLGAVGGIYALQQFGGVLVPKVLETIAAKQEHRKASQETD